MLTVHVEEHHRRAIRVKGRQEVLDFFHEHRIRTESVGAVFRIGLRGARGNARTDAFAPRLVVDPEDVEARTWRSEGRASSDRIRSRS